VYKEPSLFFYKNISNKKKCDYMRARDLNGVFLRFPLQIQATRPYNSPVPIMAGRAFALMPLVMCMLSCGYPPLRSYVRVSCQR